MINEIIRLTPYEDATLTPICISNYGDLKQTPRRAVIVCPGGGYGMLSEREAEPIAAQFLAAGFQTFILRYTVGEGAKDFQPLRQAALAIRYVRDNAEKYNIDPNYLFVCGFSAGGHLAGSTGILWDIPELADIREGRPEGYTRPNGMILCYPVINTDIDERKLSHKHSVQRLCGVEEPTPEQCARFSLEKHVNETTPPAFIWHTFPDNCVPVQNSLMLADAMVAAHVPFELHIFPKGAHGLALCNEQTASGNEKSIILHNAHWVELAIRWAKYI